MDRRARNSGRPFETRYGPADIRLLADIDEAFGQMSGLATCEILRRAFEVHGDARFERLAGISRSHVYNLREDVMTPYEKLKSLPGADSFLKEGLTYVALDRIAGARSDLRAAQALNVARLELFRRIHSAAAA